MSEIVTMSEDVRFDKLRETHFVYTESLGESYRKLKFEIYLTFDELMQLIHELNENAKVVE